MPILTCTEADGLTKPFHSVWVDAHVHAWSMWTSRMAKDPEFFKPLQAGDRYLVLHRHITEYAARELDGVVTSTDAGGFFAQVIDQRAVVRFKHLDRDLRARNYPTDQQQHLDRQEYTEKLVEQLELEGLPLPTVITLGYTLTPAEDELSRVVLTCRSPELLWCVDLLDAAEAGGSGSVEQPALLPTNDPPRPRIISTKKRSERAKGEET